MRIQSRCISRVASVVYRRSRREWYEEQTLDHQRCTWTIHSFDYILLRETDRTRPNTCRSVSSVTSVIFHILFYGFIHNPMSLNLLSIENSGTCCIYSDWNFYLKKTHRHSFDLTNDIIKTRFNWVFGSLKICYLSDFCYIVCFIGISTEKQLYLHFTRFTASLIVCLTVWHSKFFQKSLLTSK